MKSKKKKDINSVKDFMEELVPIFQKFEGNVDRIIQKYLRAKQEDLKKNDKEKIEDIRKNLFS